MHFWHKFISNLFCTGTLVNGVLIPNLLNNSLASCLLINIDLLLQHIAHFDNIITVTSTRNLQIYVFCLFFAL